jgi:hypothetical protein
MYDKAGVHRKSYPSVNKEWASELILYTDLLQKTNGGFWKFKRENNLSLRLGLPEAYVSEKLKPWAKDLMAMHGIEKLYYGAPKDDGLVEVTLPESEEVIFVRSPPSESGE